MADKPTVAVHKFSSCDGCQLAFLNAGEDLLNLAQLVDIVHFAEAGPVDPLAKVDIAFVEGSITTPHELARIKQIRKDSKYLITIGACATSGGIQALVNMADKNQWMSDIYTNPEHIDTLDTATAVSNHVKVDFEIWGCPINGHQVLTVVRSLLFGVKPVDEKDKICLECKRQHQVCVLVTQGTPCMGPVTRTGCGAICPRFGRDCFGCYGPAENANSNSLAQRFEGIGLMPDQISRRFLSIYSAAPEFNETGKKYKKLLK